MRTLLIALVSGGFCAGVVVDRIAVIAGNHIIKTSDIDRDLRLTGFLNRQTVDFGAKARHDAADRLIDQQMIRQELAAEGYSRASDDDADELEKQIVRNRYQGSSPQFQSALQRYGLNEKQFHEQLLWQLTVLRFIDQRFRPGVLVTDEEIAAYYQEHLAEIRRESPQNYTLEAVSARIRQTLESQRVDKDFDAWLTQMRHQNRIEFREAAFR
jgi:hypothetical protein